MKENILKHIYVLSKEIGPRASGTLNEKKAADYIKSVFENLKINCNVEKFKTPSSFSITYGLIYFLSVISTIFFTFSVLTGFIISLIALVIFWEEIHTRGILSKIFSTKISQNVLGEIPAKSTPLNTVFLVAHYDSSKAGPMFNPKFVKNFRFLFLLNFFSMIVISINLFVGIFFKEILFILWMFSLPFAIFLSISILLLIIREFFFQATPGANDNASGVCVMLNVAEEIAKSPFEKTQVYFLATGAEEVGMIGMLNFLKKYRGKYKNAYFINLDNLGSGILRYVTKEGMIKTYKSCSELKYFAKNVILEHNLDIRPFVYKTMATDAYALLVRGFKAMSIVGADEHGILPNWHWITDTLENIKIENIKECQKFVLEMIKKIENK